MRSLPGPACAPDRGGMAAPKAHRGARILQAVLPGFQRHGSGRCAAAGRFPRALTSAARWGSQRLAKVACAE